ncbi:Fc.00g058200.m01.CDS01 [Cosmosporella sp. VM-42]
MESNSISPGELRNEVARFYGNRKLAEQTWTLNDLQNDFQKAREKDNTVVACRAAGIGLNTIHYALDHSTAAMDLLAKAQDFAIYTAQEAAANHIVDITMRPAKLSESKATQELISSVGTTVIMSIVITLTGSTIPPAFVGGALFSVIIYLYKSGLEKEEKKDNLLAEDLWESWNKLREKNQRKLDELNETEIGKLLMVNRKLDVQDESILGSYKHPKTGQVINVRMSDAVTLLENCTVKTGTKPSVYDAKDAIVWFGLDPKNLLLKANDQKNVDSWLTQKMKQEDLYRSIWGVAEEQAVVKLPDSRMAKNSK